MNQIRIMHASDLHYSAGNLVEADRCFGYAVEEAIRCQAQVAVVTGDSTDHRLEAHSPAFLALARRIKQLADFCPVFLLQGTFSHEAPGMLHILGMIGAKHPIIVSDKIEMIGLADGQWHRVDSVDERNFDLVITSIPTVNKADLAIAVGADRANEAMGEHLAALLQQFGQMNNALRARGIPTILCSHGTVDGSRNENGVPMAGLDHEFTVGALFAAMTSASLLGHIHMHQTWERDFQGLHQVLAYPGSIGRFHYGELGEKYCLVWHVGANNATFKTVVTPSRRMIDLNFDGAPDLLKLASAAGQCKDAYVRVRYSVDEEYASTIDRQGIRDVLKGAAEVQIEGTVLTIERQRCAGISALASLEERFTRWAEHSSTPLTGLIERLGALQTKDPITIVAEFRSGNKAAAKAPVFVAPTGSKPSSRELAELLD